MDVDLSVIDMRNTMADQIAQAAKVHLQTISGATKTQKERFKVIEKGKGRVPRRHLLFRLREGQGDQWPVLQQQQSAPTCVGTQVHSVLRKIIFDGAPRTCKYGMLPIPNFVLLRLLDVNL